MAQRYPLKPLRRFEYKLVDAKLDGLLINADRDLQREMKFAESVHNIERSRWVGRLNVIGAFR